MKKRLYNKLDKRGRRLIKEQLPATTKDAQHISRLINKLMKVKTRYERIGITFEIEISRDAEQ